MNRTLTILFLIFLFISATKAQQGLSIGADSPDPQSILDIQSTTKGVFIPRMTTLQRDAIGVNAADAGLMIYNNDNDLFYYWDGAIWVPWPAAAAGGGNTLDEAYDQGGAGAGRTIIADAGSVVIAGTDGFYSTGTLNSGATAPAAVGVGLVWNPRKAAFRSGGAFGTQWNDASIGQYSAGLGFNNTGSGAYTLTGGLNTSNGAISSVAFGSGILVNVGADYSTAFGQNITIFSSHAFAGGKQHQLGAAYCTAGGESVVSLGSHSTGFGKQITMTGAYSFAVGESNSVLGTHGMAQGEQAAAKGNHSRSMGLDLESNAYAETTVGLYSTNQSGTGTSWVATDRIFTVSNGQSNLVRSDAFFILKNGNATLQGTLTQLSDRTLKKEIKPLESALAKLTQLNGYSYYWKDDSRTSEIQFGMIAQELQKVFPNLVTETGDSKILGVNYISLTPVIIEAIKEQQNEIETLQEENEMLKERLDKIEKLLGKKF